MERIKLNVLNIKCNGCKNIIKFNLQKNKRYQKNDIYSKTKDIDLNLIKETIKDLGFEVE